VKRQQLKFFNVIFIGLFYLGIFFSIARVALDANNWVGSVEET